MKTKALLISALLYLACLSPVWASDYIPDILDLDGSNGLSFPPNSTLTLRGGGTIEFWVVPDWKTDPGYEPVIISNTGEQGPSYLVAMLPNKQGLVVYSGNKRLEAAFDFTDGQMHFVAVVDFGDTLNILIDNRLIAAGEMTLVDLPSSGFFIGTADGERYPFVGAIAGLRVWDIPLDPYTLIEFAMKNIEHSSNTHPDIDYLLGLSRFRTQSFYLYGM